MFRFSWRNGLAVGIITGIGLATLTILFAQAVYDLAQCEHDAQCYRYAAQYDGRDLPTTWWWVWEKKLVTSSDTLANWIMALFTIFTVILVWRTLVATQKMVRDTARIGEAQSRAYVHADKVHFFWGNENQTRPRVEIWVRNTGLTPANWYEIRIKELVYPHEGFDHSTPIIDQVTFPEKFEGPWNAIPADGEGNKATFFFVEENEIEEINKAAMDRMGLSKPSHGFSVVGEIRYQTFFGEIFISQFAFGRAMLPTYRVDRTDTRDVDGVTINNNFERPIALSRYAAKLETYKKVKG